MKRIIASVAIVAGVIGGTASASLAAQPAHQACIGHDVSSYAEAGSEYGHYIGSLARNETPGIGGEVQAFQAGQVPDFVLPNSCND